MLKATAKRIVDMLATRPALAPMLRPPLQIAARVFLAQNRPVVSYDLPHRAKAVRLIKQVHAEREMILTVPEAYSIFATVERTAKVPGDVAEVGVYQGGSSKLICEAKGARHLHLFDTFEGLPPRKDIDPVYFSKGKFACSIESVRQYLGSYSDVSFYQGFFPRTATPVSDRRFSFVHLDVDLYESTRSCLEFFYPRMSPGGVIMSHDYFAAGVKAAFDEFFTDKPEPIIELAGDQCMVVKLALA